MSSAIFFVESLLVISAFFATPPLNLVWVQGTGEEFFDQMPCEAWVRDFEVH